MAIFTSDQGFFEITELSFTPRSVTWGDNVTLKITIKNISTQKFTKPQIYFQLAYLNTSGAKKMKAYGGLNDLAASWAKGTSITYTKTMALTKPNDIAWDESSRCLEPVLWNKSYIGADIMIFLPDGDTYTAKDWFYNVYGGNHEYLAILDAHYLPTISDTFAVNRKNDESTECWTTLQVGYVDGLTDVQKARMTYRAYYDDTEIELPDSITQDVLVAGITENYDFLSNQPVDIADDHVIKVVFGDQYEQAEDSRTVMRCFANLHLSGYRTGGVCVGGFCDDEKDSDGNHIAKFECYYPAYFYNGITVGGGSGGSIELEADTLLFGFMSNSKKDIYLTVPVPYMPTNVTAVTVTSIKGNVRCAGGYGAASGYVEGGTDYTSLVAAVTPCPSSGTVVIKLTRSTAMNGTNNYALTFQVSELKMTIS